MRKQISWYRYRLDDRLRKTTKYFTTARAVAKFMGFKSTYPIGMYFREEVKMQSRATIGRWSRFKLTKVFIPNWKAGNKYTIKRKLKLIRKGVHDEIVRRGLVL